MGRRNRSNENEVVTENKDGQAVHVSVSNSQPVTDDGQAIPLEGVDNSLETDKEGRAVHY